MYKYNLTNKNVIALILLVFLFNFIVIKNVSAEENNSNNAPAPQSAGSATSGTPYTNINVPSENIKKIPIIGYKFVYKTYDASLVSFLEKKIDELTSDLISVGIKEKNLVIIFLDYTGYSDNTLNNMLDSKNKTTSTDSANNAQKYLTKEGISLDLSKIRQNYPVPFLATKRKILIGTLVDNSTAFRGNQVLNVVKFNMPDAQGFEYYSKSSYLQNKKVATSKQNATNLTPKKTEKKTNGASSSSSYNKEELVEQRANMIQYMNLSIFKKTNFIGMMEYHDTANDIYSYFALPGKLNDFLYPKKN